jgi:hypothetical protein
MLWNIRVPAKQQGLVRLVVVSQNAYNYIVSAKISSLLRLIIVSQNANKKQRNMNYAEKSEIAVLDMGYYE